MKKILLPLITIFFLAIFTSRVYAGSLNVSKNANFSSGDLNFSGGDKVYARVDSDGSGSSKRILNIRDSQYNLINTLDLAKSGKTFSASFNAPNTQGYFSLEAVIEGDGESSKSVRTIKVGSPSGANVKVNVKSSVKGTKSSYMTDGTSGTDRTNEESVEGDSDQVNSASPTPEVYASGINSEDQVKPAKGNWFFMIFINIFSFLWPFK